jgi:hypothetical protein
MKNKASDALTEGSGAVKLLFISCTQRFASAFVFGLLMFHIIVWIF